jgi:hypothetical protein
MVKGSLSDRSAEMQVTPPHQSSQLLEPVLDQPDDQSHTATDNLCYDSSEPEVTQIDQSPQLLDLSADQLHEKGSLLDASSKPL